MKFEWSEVFKSIEGEARWSGHPTIYVRFTKCNFQCKKFNNPNNLDPSDKKTLGFDPGKIKSLDEVPSISIGCDSIYSWHKDFSHIWRSGDEEVLAKEISDHLPPYGWESESGQKVILSLTGGEPTLRAKQIPALLFCNSLRDVRHVLIETNCSVPLKNEFIDDLNQWAKKRDGLIIWSNSPKLRSSGELPEKAIVPDVALMQRALEEKHFDQYFKFVCSDNESDFNEVSSVMEVYYKAGIPRDVDVYIMPMACLESQQVKIMKYVAMKCLDRGYIYCHRIHNTVFENAIGK